MEPRARSGLVATASHALGDLPQAAARDRHPRADGVAVGDRTLQPKRQEVAPTRLVVKVGQRPLLSDKHRVDSSVVIQIASGEAPAEARNVPGRASPTRFVWLLVP